MRWITLLFLGQLSVGDFSITFPNSEEKTEIPRIHEFYQPSPLVDSVANLGIHAVTDLLASRSNAIISPVNIFLCLDVLQLGAAGETKEEIERIVGRSDNEETGRKILDFLKGTSHASAVFFSESIQPTVEFLRKSCSRYQTEVKNVNFKNNDEATSVINSWVREKTNGTIRELLRRDLTDRSEVIVVNTLLFNGKWLHPFSALVTETGRFEIDERNFVDVAMMHLEAYLPVIRRSHYNALGLPYRDGNLVMYMILPHDCGMHALKKVLYSLSPTDVKNFPVSSVSQMAFVEMPKFKIDATFSLRDALERQGMKTSFDPILGNFTGFTGNQVENIFISDIYHSVHFEVTEHETIASAASAVIFTKTRSFEFRATRPFIFVITDGSGLMLFMGVVTRPE